MATTFSDDPPSPCIGVCMMNSQTQLCDGCFRNLDEIAGWMNYSRTEKEAVLAELDQRRDKISADAFFN